ncbi:1,2-phenylacetyl-CoA epoxidase subunit PaaC [Breoghania sp. L-A4]|uniref:1,2-phenylacetyl-CoA epoxidase subunit PaaC n=1 Tax=Breoghania sp. L-A4 TaxID=2304600 RepID=UPI0020BFB1FC|nr:1,2-phenylacetyl-CoA epoxidase subunit PaaC [Breoghania sp. L-A4]
MPSDTERLLFRYCLGLADDAAILSLRLGEWTGRAPGLDEDIALTNIALDLLGQARALYGYAAELEGEGRHEDELAYLRAEQDFYNVLLVEQPNGDFTSTMARQFLFSAVRHPFWLEMRGSADGVLARLADETERQFARHLRLTGDWLIRRGGETEIGNEDCVAAFSLLWPYFDELLECDALSEALILRGAAVDPRTIRGDVDATLRDVLTRANLVRPTDSFVRSGGRQGRHSSHLGPLLARMQPMQRAFPGLRWDPMT